MVSGPNMWISIVAVLLLVTLQVPSAQCVQIEMKKECQFQMGSAGCKAAEMRNIMSAFHSLKSSKSPGKRDLTEGYQTMSDEELDELLRSLREQISALYTLRLLSGQSDLGQNNQEKRTCRFGLGNHCETEALDRAASQYYYLKSFKSPGKRRREAADDGSFTDSLEEGEEDVVVQKKR